MRAMLRSLIPSIWRNVAAVAVLGTACASVAPAYAVVYMTNGGSQISIGDQIGSSFDQLILDPYTGTIFGDGNYVLNPLHFVAGINANSPWTVSGTLSEILTIGANTRTLTIPYTVDISSSDTLNIAGGTTWFFPGYHVVLNSFGPIVNSGGTMDDFLYAAVSAVPEPSTWALMFAGFGMIGFAMRRRPATKGEAAYA